MYTVSNELCDTTCIQQIFLDFDTSQILQSKRDFFSTNWGVDAGKITTGMPSVASNLCLKNIYDSFSRFLPTL